MSKEKMKKLFNEFNYKYSLWEVFQDFLYMSAAAISNRVDLINAPRREKEYMKLAKKYEKKDLDIFGKLLGELIITLTETPGDILGELFMEMELGNSWKGQFFTPFNLSLLTAEVMMLDNLKEVIEKKGYIELNEPTCGSAGMVIAFAEAMKKRRLNPQRQLYCIAQDLDQRCVWMAYIQLSLLGIPAQVLHCNTLSLQVYDVWKTPFYILGGWFDENLRPKAKTEIKIEEVEGQFKFVI